jgi:hypothetical protein
MTNLSAIFFISQIFPLSLTEHTKFIGKHSVVIVETFKVKVYLLVSRLILHNLFAWSWWLHLLGNFLVSSICTWCHFLGVQLYSNYTIGCQNFERVLCLILSCCLAESVSSDSILCCQSYLQECISRRGLLHYSEGAVFVLR